MKTLILLLALLVSSPAWATFTLVQAKSNNSCSSATCAVTVASTGAGHALVEAAVSSTIIAITASTGCAGSWTFSVGSVGGSGNFVAMGYCLNASAGVTSVSMTISGTMNGIGATWESSSTGTITFDTSNTQIDASACTTSCAGVGLTLGGSNDAIFTIASCGSTCSAITTYSADPATPWPGGDGMAHLINTASGTAPTWTQGASPSQLTSGSIALKDAASVGAVRHRMWVISK